MCINKIQFIDSEKQNLFYKELASFLTPFFANDYYNDVNDLHEDFKALQHDEVYPLLLESAAQHCKEKTGIYIPGTELQSISFKRWKLCIVCNKPFISHDRYNKSKICYSTSYRRFKQGQGVYFKSTNEGVSECYMNYRNAVVKRSMGKVN